LNAPWEIRFALASRAAWNNTLPRPYVCTRGHGCKMKQLGNAKGTPLYVL